MKHTLKKLSGFVLAAALVMSCGGNTENKETHEAAEHSDEHAHASDTHEHAKEHEVIVSSDDFVSISEQIAKSLTESYLELKDALVNSDTDKSKEVASGMVSILNDVEVATAGVSDLKEDAQLIASAENIEKIREHFEEISQNVYNLAKTKNSGVTLYKQFCPMAFDNEGAFWLSAKEEIRNPYFGDKMLKCGRVEETIAVK